MAEKIRLVLVAKREKLLQRRAFTADETVLLEWLRVQKSYRLYIDQIPDDLKIRMAKQLVLMFGDKLL